MTRKGKKIDFPVIEEKISNMCTKFAVDLLYVFGSYASGKMSELSDLDIAFFAKKKIDELELLAQLQQFFEEEAIDLVNLKDAPAHLVHRVLRDGKCLYASDLKLKIDFESKKESEYFDSQWLREDYFKEMVRRVEDGTYGIG